MQGGEIDEANEGAHGVRFPDENTSVRHFKIIVILYFKRGILTMANDGENSNGSKFMITLDAAD